MYLEADCVDGCFVDLVVNERRYMRPVTLMPVAWKFL